jgi:hypothetical protein
MRRRVFLSACTVALIGSLPGKPAAADRDDLKILLAVAEVIVPDKDPATWQSGSAVDELVSRWQVLEDSRRNGLLNALEMLESESGKSGGGGKFASLDKESRTALVRRLLEKSEDFASNFSILRPLIVRSFYSSKLGFERTGYRSTTQFIGYPEHVESAEIWE